jgi:hypothetical protein
MFLPALHKGDSMHRDTLHDISTHIIAVTCLLIIATGGFIAGHASRAPDVSPSPQIHSFGPGPTVGGFGPNVPDTPKREIIALPPGVDLDRSHPPTRN